jgi:hypothetical protein
MSMKKRVVMAVMCLCVMLGMVQIPLVASAGDFEEAFGGNPLQWVNVNIIHGLGLESIRVLTDNTTM